MKILPLQGVRKRKPILSDIRIEVCRHVRPLFPILRSTFNPNLKQIGQKMIELSNGRHLDGGAAGNRSTVPPPRRSQYRVIASRRHYYTIPHPTIYLLPQAKRPKNDRVIKRAFFFRVTRPEMAPRRHVRRRSIAVASLHHSLSYDLPSSQI